MSKAVSAGTGRHLIAGEWLSPAGRTFASHNPARLDEAIGIFPWAGKEEASQAVAAAAPPIPDGGAAAASIAPNCLTTSPRSSSARRIASPG